MEEKKADYGFQMESFYNFYHTHVTKTDFESNFEDIIHCYNLKMFPDDYKIAAVLSYCRDKLLIKPPKQAKNDLSWLRLATTKEHDPRYDLSAVSYNGTWSYGCDGVRCHAVKRRINPDMAPGDKLTAKDKILTPTPQEESRDMDFDDVIRDTPDINKLRLKEEEMVEVSLTVLPNETYGNKDFVVDKFRIESICPTKRLDGGTVSFNRKYYREATSHIVQPKVFMAEGKYLSPVMFVSNNYLALVMPINTNP